ncbi:hypothetical protein BDZ91DRAFT_763484 [Kalaharituber pfeilii]|nr:hypothetical protein BDZ91DRAFT_763484 [Kalaharituber pfeilii]
MTKIEFRLLYTKQGEPIETGHHRRSDPNGTRQYPIEIASSTEESEGDEDQVSGKAYGLQGPKEQEGESQKMDYTLGDESLGGSSHAHAGKMERIAKTQSTKKDAPIQKPTKDEATTDPTMDTQGGESQKMDYTLGDESLGGSSHAHAGGRIPEDGLHPRRRVLGREQSCTRGQDGKNSPDSTGPASTYHFPGT